ncbi:hypothetical protein [Trinickia acidisoli]|uniref:hypothetical protein n=1 Tax=Trinickia acidisoli TaxID=2767482 RepID=UPI001A8D1B13|nr:hypothetical protein [Trinickia acidisoli]
MNVPVFGLAGTCDRLIAPGRGCEALVVAYGSDDATYRLCGKAQGFAEDYMHDRLVLSRNANRETWPMITGWLRAHSGETAIADKACDVIRGQRL